MKKRVLSMFMALALCLTLLPAPAWAAEADAPEGGAAQIGETVYPTLPDAVNAAQDGDTIKLLADYKPAEGSGGEEASGLTITKSVTLNLNGYEMDDFRVAQVDEETDEVLTSGNLTVEDTSAAQNGKVTGTIELMAGKLTINGGTIGDGRDGVSIENGNLIVNGGTIDFLYGSNSGTVTINGGTVKNARFSEGFNITVTGGSGHTGLWNVMEGTWNISGGEFEDVVFQTKSPAENLHITGGTFGTIARKILKIGGNGEEVPAPISGLLADGYAFYQKTDSEEYNQCVKLTDAITSRENVQVKGHTHSFVNGVCTDCDYACLHTNMNGDGSCPDCNTQMVAKVEVGGTVTYSADFKEAMNNAENGTTVTLLADIEWGVTPQDRAAITGDGKIVTLNLNRHTITGGWLDVGNGKSPTSCTLKIIGKGSHESLSGMGGIITVNMKATLDLSKWEGGTISSINISDDSNVEKDNPNAREAAVIVGPKAGTIGKLTFGNNQLDKLKKTKLSGGSFNEIWVADFGPVKLGELLADGYAYQNADGSYVEYGTKLQGASIYNVKVVKCLHPNMKPDAATGVATCEYCGKSGKFVASVDGNLYTADQWKDAFKAWLGDAEDEKANGILKLYTDYKAEAADATWSVGYRPNGNTLDLNGHRMSVQGDGAFKPTNNMHLTVTDGTKLGQITNILLDGSQRGSFTLESGIVCNLKMTGGAVVTLKGGSVDNLDVKNCSENTNLSIQGGSLGKLNIEDWAEDMHVSATGGSLGAYNLPSGKILADVLDHQYYAEGTSLDKQVDTAQRTEKFVINQAPYDFGSTSKAADVPINGSIPFMVDSPSENVGVYDVKWYRRTTSGAVHMTENKVAGVNVNDKLDVFCVITGLDRPGGAMQWQVAVKDYTIKVVPADLSQGAVVFTQTAEEFAGTMGNIRDGKGTFVFTPYGGDVNNASTLTYCFEVSHDGQKLIEGKDYTIESGNTAQYAGDHTLTIQGKGSYTGTATHTWRIEPYKLTRGNYRPPTITKVYDGTTGFDFSKAGRGIFTENVDHRPNGAGTGKNPSLGADGNSISIYLKPDDFEASAVTLDSPDAGDRTASFTIELKTRDGQREPNFAFEDGGSPTIQVTGAAASITKAPAPTGLANGALTVYNGTAKTYEIDIASLLPSPGAGCRYGEIYDSQTIGSETYKTEITEIKLDSSYYDKTADKAKIEKGKLILPIRNVNTTTTGKIGTIKLNVISQNYHQIQDWTIDVSAANQPVSTGGGGGGGSSSGSTVKTGTVTNPDGSVTKTETKKDGTKVETTTAKDGSTFKTTTNPNGSSVTENKAADGSTGTVKTDKNGQTTAETTLSSKAIEDAKRNGEPVKAPVEVKATRDSDTAPTVKIELPRNSGDTKVEIPVSNVKPGTVAVLVHADGTEEIVKNSLPTEDGIQLTVNGGATVKIVDNSKDFADTRNHWAKDAIDFVSARGLVNGMNDSIYAPNNSTTRAQL
ncbi:S-layer homology domain-containing protein, partial [Agathobaculum butyriciproducens]